MFNTNKENDKEIDKEIEKICQEPHLKLRRQTHLHCDKCQDVAEYYNQECCHRCGNSYKWNDKWSYKWNDIPLPQTAKVAA